MVTRLTPEQVQQIRGTQASSGPRRLTPEEVQRIRGGSAGVAPVEGGMTARDKQFLGENNKLFSGITGQDISRQEVYDAMGTPISDQNVKKGEGSGREFTYTDKDTGIEKTGRRRTFSEIYGNVGNAFADAGVGVVKAVGRIPTKLGQAANSIAPNSVYSPATQEGTASREAFDKAYKGSNAAQKIGATAFDIASIFAPAGMAGNAVTKSVEAVPFIAKYASQAGNVGRAARLAPKVTGALAEGVIADAASTGDVDAGTVGFAAGIPIAGSVLRGGKRLIQGAKATAREAGEKFINRLEEGSPAAVGELAEGRNKFTTALREAMGGSRNRAANRAVDTANAKLVYGGKIPEDDDVFGVIFDKAGGLDGVDQNGFFITDKAQGMLDKDINRYATRARELFGSVQAKIDNNSLRDDIMSAVKSTDDLRGTKVREITNILNRNLKQGKQATAGELMEISKKLRSDAYNAMTQGPKETARAEAYRQAAKKIDDLLYERLDEIDPKLANDLRDELTRLYSAKDVLVKLQNVKAPEAISGRTATILGTLTGNLVGGYGLGGLIAGGIGGTVAPKINKALNIAYGKGKVSSQVMQKVSQYMTEKDFQKISKIVDENISRNTKAKRIRDFLSKVKMPKDSNLADMVGPKTLPAPKAPLGLPGVQPQTLLPESTASSKFMMPGKTVTDDEARGFSKTLKDYLR